MSGFAYIRSMDCGQGFPNCTIETEIWAEEAITLSFGQKLVLSFYLLKIVIKKLNSQNSNKISIFLS